MLEYLFKNQPSAIGSAAAIIFRLPVWQSTTRQEAFSRGELRDLLLIDNEAHDPFVRVRGKPVYMIGTHEYRHWISSNINQTCLSDPFLLASGDVSKLFKLLRNSEIDSLVERGRAIMPEINNNILYRAPSGSYQKFFLRAGNIQFSQSSLDAVFFWLLPSLERCCSIMTETWSISSIALNCSRRLASYRSSNSPCLVEMLPSYDWYEDSDDLEAADHIEVFMRLSLRRARFGDQVYFLMSAVNSGGFYQRICARLIERGFDMDRISFATIFNLGHQRSELPCLRDLSLEAKDGRFASVEVEPSVPPIQIDPHTYFPSRYTDVLHKIRRPDSKAIRAFFNRHKSEQLVKVHKDVDDGGSRRHHAIWVDTEVLIAGRVFSGDLKRYLKNLVPAPAIVITPLHEAATKLARKVCKTCEDLGIDIEHLGHPNLYLADNRLEDAGIMSKINSINASEASILVMDDAFITGRRLSVYQSNLRATNFEGVVHYMVAVARPEDEAEWTDQVAMLEYRPPEWPLPHLKNTVYAFDLFCIPNWGTKDCPWCQEIRFYYDAAKKKQDDEIGKKHATRRNMLQVSAKAGLTDRLFLDGLNGTLLLTPRSIFRSSVETEAALFAAVASAIQTHRQRGYPKAYPLGPRQYPIATVILYVEYLQKVFTDSMVRACLIRASKAYELTYSDAKQEEKRCAAVLDILRSQLPRESELIPELLFANAMNKISEIAAAALDDLLLGGYAADAKLFRKLSHEETERTEASTDEVF